MTAAIQAQTAGPWEESAGSGGTIAFPQTGTMAIRHTESGLREVLDLLTTYRKALLASKLRKQDVVDPKEVVTRYYRMHERIADDLVRILPQLVQPETWQSDAKPDAAGYVLKTASGFKFLDMQGMIIHADANKDEKSQTHALVASQAVLIIHQTRAAHEEIAEVIRRVEQGDAAPEPAQSGMGGMGGGFGSGYFSVR